MFERPWFLFAPKNLATLEGTHTSGERRRRRKVNTLWCTSPDGERTEGGRKRKVGRCCLLCERRCGPWRKGGGEGGGGGRGGGGGGGGGLSGNGE